VRFLIDNALSPQVAAKLATMGHDAIHVRDIGIASSSDEVIFGRAAAEGRILVSVDTDFGTLLALRREMAPSVILLRRRTDRRPARQAAIILANLSNLADSLQRGCIAVIEESRVRVRLLPIAD
jgi:predicted nuclease of predicted toxin-antitoxin system